jgi:hypothetical protein
METENKTENHINDGKDIISFQIPQIDNITSKRSIIPVSYAVIILLFFMNFFVVNCGGQKIGSITGITLVTGAKSISNKTQTNQNPESQDWATNYWQNYVNDLNKFANPNIDQKIQPNIWAIIAFLSAIVGLIQFMIKVKNEDKIAFISGIIGFFALIILQSTLKSSVTEQTQGIAELTVCFPYVLALIIFAIVIIISYLRMKKIHAIADIFQNLQRKKQIN